MAGLLTIRFNSYWKDSDFFLPSHQSRWRKNHFSNNSIVNIIFFYHRRVLSCVWILGPWSYGCTGIWSCSFYWRPHQVLHKTAPRWAQLLSSQKFPSQRYQMLQYFTQQQVCLLFIVYLHLFYPQCWLFLVALTVDYQMWDFCVLPTLYCLLGLPSRIVSGS